MIYVFESFELDTERLELRHDGVARAVEPQVFALLELLLSNPERTVTKDELHEKIWHGRIVSDSVVNSRISSARLVIDDDGKQQRLIKTLHRQGFRFIGGVRKKKGHAMAAADTSPAEAPVLEADAHKPQKNEKPSIAILPFRLVGVAGPYAGIADALPYELISELSRMRWLDVIARGTSFQFRETDPDIQKIGKRLAVRYCLTGVVEVIGETIRVIVEVAETANAGIVWSGHFEDKVDGVQEIRRQITANVTAALEVFIPRNEARLARMKSAENLDAWSLYHLGLQHLYRFTRDDNDKAAHLFRQAIEREPDLTRAHAALSSTEYYNARTHYTDDYGACAKRCQGYAERSLEIDPYDPYANYAMGRAMTVVGDLEGSANWYDRTLSLRPSYAQCLYSIALTDTLTEEAEAGRSHVDLALSLSPLDPFLCAMYSVRAFASIINEDYNEAAKWSEKVMATPNVHPHYASVPVIAHTLNGDKARAEHWNDKLKMTSPGSTYHDFFASFPFREGAVRARIKEAFLVHGR